MSAHVEAIPIAGLPEIEKGDDLGALIAGSASRGGLELTDFSVLVVAQKVVSKAEGRTVALTDVAPGERARELAGALGKDPRLVELVLRESRGVLRAERGVLIAETRGGWICANAGIDASNVPGEDRVTLLPEDPDASARRLRAEIRSTAGANPAVLVADSFGRPWRLGQSDVAIGCAGLIPLDDWRGRRDREDRGMSATVIALADEVAAAADLARGKDAGVPIVLVRGLERFVSADDGPGARAIQRPEGEDLFR